MPAEWSRRIGHVLEQRAQESIDVSCEDCIYSVNIVPVPEVDYVNLYGRDITERMRAIEAREKSERTVRAIFDTATDGILLADAVTRRFVKVNPALCRMLGYSQEEIERLSVADIHPADRLEQAISEFEKMLGGETVLAYDIPVKRKDGSVFLADIVSSPLELDGHPHLLGIFRDITDRKRLEQERMALEAQLRQQQKLEAIGTLASGVAHEINNPISGIMNYAQLIADKAEPASQPAEYAKEIIQETERVATIVRNLLQFARQEKQTHSLARPADIVEQTLSLVRAVLRRDQITLTVAVPEDLPPIKCRSQQLQQVLMNLLTNARDALNAKYPGYHADKTITVRAQLLDHDGRRWLRLTVADQGPGIPPEIQARIFDPFFTTKPRDKGTGGSPALRRAIGLRPPRSEWPRICSRTCHRSRRFAAPAASCSGSCLTIALLRLAAAREKRLRVGQLDLASLVRVETQLRIGLDEPAGIDHHAASGRQLKR